MTRDPKEVGGVAIRIEMGEVGGEENVLLAEGIFNHTKYIVIWKVQGVTK